MRITWDDSKSEKLKKDRGLSFEEAANAVDGPHFMTKKSEDPEQYLGIGFANGELITVIYEFREDGEGEFIWLVTYWKATKREAKYYEEFRRR